MNKAVTNACLLTALAMVTSMAAGETLPDTDARQTAFDALCQEKRSLILAAKPVVQHTILFVVREQYAVDHHNTATIFQTGEVNTNSFAPGGALKALDVRTGAVRTLLETETGVIRDPEVSFDGKRIVFSMRRERADNYHIYEMNADGSGLRQLTGAPGVADIDPLYLPDGGIVFSSTREPKYCMCNIHIMANLFRMDGDGANIHQIGRSTLFEGHASLLEDGRILYDRWEYVDRNFGDAQGLWTVNPDGTNHAIYYGNNTWSPGGVIDARPIPGTGKVVCILGSCHDRPWGAMAVIERERAIDGAEAVIRTWPESAAKLVEAAAGQAGYGFDSTRMIEPKYEDPYPLDEHHFLCSRMTGEGERMGIYLVDTLGNETLVHVEGPGCFDPMPLAPRERPMVIPPRRTYDERTGVFYVADVYTGTHMQGVPRGAVKSLRVVASPEKRYWSEPSWNGQGVHRPAMNWHDFSNKRILGTVPVEADGSACFEAPADTFLYFQLLDENGMMVQSMRSGVMVQPGERLGCVGCHDNRRAAPPALAEEMPLAVLREPDALQGWHGPPRDFSFMAEVQPVFNRHCVECHDYGKEAGETLNLAPDRAETFNTSYVELWRKGLLAAIGAGPADVQPPYAWGSHPSKLVQVVREGHHEVQLSAEEFDRLVTWVDINAPYYPTYATAYPDHLTGRSPLDNAELARLQALTDVNFGALAGYGTNTGSQISFDRPELSPCLDGLSDASARAEAIAIIAKGRERLAERPRGDMPGFAACPTDQNREMKYEARARTEAENRAAILGGKRLFDPDTPMAQREMTR